MQQMKKFWLAAVAALAVISLGTPVIAQKKASAQQLVIKNAVDSQQYIFVARYANPMQGGQRYLTTEYTVQVSKNSVVSFLPYFGVAYQAPINPAEGGIQFTSTAFDYTVKAGKRKTWQVSIKPADAPEVQQLTLTIFNSGEASLQVISTNKQAISYNGYIMSVKATH
jgi:hypothetical protein